MHRLKTIFFDILLIATIFLVVIAIFSTAALAGGEDGTTMLWWEQALIAFFVGFGAIILEFMRRGMTKLFDYLAERSNLAFLAKVDDFMMDEVTSLFNKEVKHAKAAAEDNKLSGKERDRFAEIAAEEVKDLLGLKGLKKLGSIVNGNVETALAKKVEKAVTAAKNAGAIRKGPPKPSA